MRICEIVREKRGRCIVFTDSDISFPLYTRELDLYRIYEDAAFRDDDYLKLRAEVLSPRARNRALHIVSVMDRTEHQLRERLKLDGYQEDIIDDAVEYLKRYRYIDDHRYACAYVRLRAASKSRYQLRMQLLEKGISADTADKALREEYTGDEEDLIRGILKKKNYDPELSDPGERSKIFRSLMRKGFEYSAVKHAMEKQTGFPDRSPG